MTVDGVAGWELPDKKANTEMIQTVRMPIAIRLAMYPSIN